MSYEKEREDLFKTLNNISKTYESTAYVINSLKSIVQNECTIKDSKNIAQFKQECKMANDLIEQNTKECKKELSNWYRRVISLHNNITKE